MKNLKDITFAFLDVETTGLASCYGDKVCEVAILKSHNGKKLDSFQSLIDPCRSISQEAYEVNGITQDMLRNKPKFSQIVGNILKILDGSVIVCHNAPFDMGFLEAEFNEAGISVPYYAVVDTLSLARKYFKFYSNSLGNIAECLGIKVNQEHRAMSDCITTHRIFYRFIDNFKWRGITTLDEILSLQNESSRERWNREFALPPYLEEAVKEKKTLRLTYVSQTGRRTERIVEPIEIEQSGNHIYLIANCRLKKAERMFRLDRIVGLKAV